MAQVLGVALSLIFAAPFRGRSTACHHQDPMTISELWKSLEGKPDDEPVTLKAGELRWLIRTFRLIVLELRNEIRANAERACRG